MRTKLFTTGFISICAGLAFSGYLSAVKLFSDSCAFNETCPYFLGYPACWYGFAMYLAMFVVTTLTMAGRMSRAQAINTNIFISILGILFSGRYAVEELLRSEATGSLGLSTCVYGFIFYVLIFIIFVIIKKKKYYQ